MTVKLEDLAELDFSVYAVFCSSAVCMRDLKYYLPSPVSLISILLYNLCECNRDCIFSTSVDVPCCECCKFDYI